MDSNKIDDLKIEDVYIKGVNQFQQDQEFKQS